MPKHLLEAAERNGALRYLSPTDSATCETAGPSSRGAWVGMAQVLHQVQDRIEARRNGDGDQSRRGTVRVVVNDLGGWEWGNPTVAVRAFSLQMMLLHPSGEMDGDSSRV